MIPIIFVHYGNTPYLHHCFKAIRYFNPDVRIILIGDNDNKSRALSNGLEHVHHRDLICPRIKEFCKVFKIVGGRQFNARGGWVSFVFRKWFFLYNLCKMAGFDRFWNFDTDVLVLTNLDEVEYRYRNCDYTKLNNGVTISGLVNNIDKIKDFTDFIILSMQDDDLHEQLRSEYKVNVRSGYTIMRASVEFEKVHPTNIIVADRPVHGAFFDTALYQANNFEFDSKRRCKVVIWNNDKPYCRYKDGILARMLSANFSNKEGAMPGYLKRMSVK